MGQTFDCIVVGAGISGSVVARHAAQNLGKKVLLIERRDHIGGNMADYVDANGILVHKYGPHLFHTNKEELVEYLSRFAEWRNYRLQTLVQIDGKFTPAPFNFQTIDDFYPDSPARDLKDRLIREYGAGASVPFPHLAKSSDAAIRGYAEFLFEKDYRPYTAKQWGIPPNEIDTSVLARVPVRISYDADRFDDKHQLLPKVSYLDFFRSLLDHPNITLRLRENALDSISANVAQHSLYYRGELTDLPVVFTGALDELFGFRHGALPYRSLHFESKTLPSEDYQPGPVVAYPQDPHVVRMTEYRKMMEKPPRGVTTVVAEYSLASTAQQSQELYYVVPTDASKRMVEKYNADAIQIPNLFLCGRLAEYRYYNMDEALESALRMAGFVERYLAKSPMPKGHA